MKKINAVVVTYNRQKLLEECIDSLLEQTYELNKIFIIDNASTDGTKQFVIQKYSENDKVIFISLSKNYGGAGGFYYGIRKAYMNKCDWVWIMDDDTIPTKSALEELIKSTAYIDEKISFLASTVFGPNGEPMNVPDISKDVADNGYKDWYCNLSDGIVKIESATFVSLLVNTDAIERVGAPHPDFFIWGDDTEYTMRMTMNYGPAFLVGKSKVIHKRIGAKNLSMLDENNINRIKMYTHHYTNKLVIKKFYKSNLNLLYCEYSMLKDAFHIIFSKKKYKRYKLMSIFKGYFDYVFGRYGKYNFANRFHNMNIDLLGEDK